MRHRRQLAVGITVFALAIASACGVKDSDQTSGADNSNLNLSPFDQLVGDWSGIYRTIEHGAPSGDASEARMELKNNGNFSLSLNTDGSARAEGAWSEFQGRSMILKVSGSSIPRVGSAGKIVELSYELQGSSLRISSELFELKLTRRTDESTGGPPGGVGPGENLGSWSCQDGQNRQSSLGLGSDGTFFLTTTKPGQRLFIAKGHFTREQGGALRLTPTRVSDPLPPGSFFEFKRGSSAAELSFVSSDSQRTISLGSCHPGA